MINLVWSSSFKKSFKRIIQNQPSSKKKIIVTMELLQVEPFSPQLKTHKLKGLLEGQWACSAGYDFRIIFDFVKNSKTNQTELLLIDIGTHEEVY